MIEEPESGGYGRAADAVVEQRNSRISIIWLIPLVAALVGGFVAWRAFSERGSLITISFRTAEGLEAGKTKIKYKDVEIGVVEDVRLEPDLSGVVCNARMVPSVSPYLREKTTFWIVKPRFAGGQVSGLSTLLSGSYIGIDPVNEGKHVHHFTGLEVPPVVTTQDPGRYFMLRSNRTGALDVGSGVYFQRIAVGRVVSSELDSNSDFVTTRIFVQAPYDQRVRANTRFWNASGVELSVGAEGVKLQTQSLASILIGGVAFETPKGHSADIAAADTMFPLYQSWDSAQKRHYTLSTPYLLYFDQSVRGLAVGSPVEFRGIPVGEVTDVKLELDGETGAFRIPVQMEIEPERFTSADVDEASRRELVDRMVANGLRAQLKTGNLLTGQLLISLDFHKDAKPAQMVWSDPPQFPTVPTPIEEIAANLTRLVERLSQIPVEKIGKDLSGSLAALRITLQKSENVAPALEATLAEAQKALASASSLIGPESNVNGELQRALLELSEAARALGLAADQFQAQPSSVIFGKKGSK